MNFEDVMCKKNITCCFSGHRPWKLAKVLDSESDFDHELTAAVKSAVSRGFWYFIAGGGLGFDTLAAETVIGLKKFEKLFLEIAVPCAGQSDRWSRADRYRYKTILYKADLVSFISEEPYTSGCMRARNRYMVDKSGLLICAFGGEPGGTAETVNYARKSGLEVVNILAQTP